MRSDEDRVSVGFLRSGGLAGITLAVETDTSELPPGQGEIVRTLLATPGSSPPSAPQAPDQFTYELRLGQGRRQRVLRWQETAVPDAVRPLIDELTSRARPIP